MPWERKDGTVNVGKRTIIDDLTHRTDISRQRKWQIRKARQKCCTICGNALTESESQKNIIRDNTVQLIQPERCSKCEATYKEIKKGNLQGRKGRDYEPPFDVEGTCD